ncbi:MAG TPA: alpha/beta fold hydrolase [Steroidobacteraceae bacterium]|jgi:dipeptidyl aminopeptidase/acylaminoacyl peptidase
MQRIILAVLVLAAQTCGAANAPDFDAAAAFGSRPSVDALSISPDGQNVAWIASTQGPASAVVTMSLAPGSKPHGIMQSSGRPERLRRCDWVSNDRLVCEVMFLHKDPIFGPLPFTRMVAVNTDGSNMQILSTQTTSYSRGVTVNDGEILDWLPAVPGSVLMARARRSDDHIGSHLGSAEQGLGVDQVDTRNQQSTRIEKPRREAWEYITDGRGHVRIIGLGRYNGRDQETGLVTYSYHPKGSTDLQTLSTWRWNDFEGFLPGAVDPDLNLAYGYKKHDGRLAVYTMALDGSNAEQLRYANPDVDVMSLVYLGRHHRVVGASYVLDYTHTAYFAPDVQQLAEKLGNALHATLNLVDANDDESRLVVQTSSDVDPGVYYIFDRASSHLQTFLVVRSQLEGVKLAVQRPVTYAAADGTQIPGYLTLPPGVESIKGLPAIVMPHGGPSSRDVWGFDWMVQFFANRGYAVLQPNFRGSYGYGDTWFNHNGFHSWRTAIGDVLDGGRWLVKEGVDPARLGIFGWSYGGYAALQSAVVDPQLFKAVVAVAPVTDLAQLKEDSRHWSNFEVVSEEIGDGPHVREGSPAQHADRFRVPVLMFHGVMDRNVSIEQSKLMDARLKSAGAQSTLVTWDDLDHQLDDSAARTELLRRSDAFLRKAFGM